MSRFILCTVVCVLLSPEMNLLWCQHASNISASQVGNSIVVDYTLDKSADIVQLTVSRDGGRTFSQPLKMVTGDISNVCAGSHRITWNVISEFGELVGDDIVFCVIPVLNTKAKPSAKSEKKISPAKNRFLVEADLAVTPQISYGFMFGMVKKVGWYVKGRSDFSFPEYSYECTSDGKASGGSIWTSGESKKSRLVGTAGVFFKAAKFLYPYAGIGYGSRSVVWQDVDGKWAKVTDYSCSGVSLDAGLVFNFGKFAVSVGVTNTAFKFTEVEVGVGVMF